MATVSMVLELESIVNQKNLDEARLFVEWLGSKEAQEIQGKSGTVISARVRLSVFIYRKLSRVKSAGLLKSGRCGNAVSVQ